ncbi:membrane protein [Caldovatus sediminis]|uniref:Membrane protein n=1 Tax=Caldovatus sediminis TaxID=2041189 RepID=A0A8J3EDJ9_9PROT|nr:OmpA family protein [Caldovatus sediminis]GGG45219.1 membrane protein [Caldovatus sediminis]
MRFRKALLAGTAALAAGAALLAAPSRATAQPVTGLYIGGSAGVNWLQSTNDTTDPRTEAGLALGGAFKGVFHTGAAGVLSLGWGFGNGLRAEVEGNFRWNPVDEVTAFNQRLRRSGGYARSYGVMANVFYDFDPRFLGLAQQSWIQPYVGAGIGWVWHEYDRVRGRFPFAPGTSEFRIDDTDGRFAYQVMLGAAFPFAPLGVPGLTLTAEYRFMGTLNPALAASVRTPATGGAFVPIGNIEPQNFNHSLLVGVRYAFAPPRPPAPAPAPAPAVAPAPRTFLVFFDWDRADLTARARQIVAEAAQAARTQQVTRIEVAGHADRSGSAQYNQRLSQRRADNVAAELVRNGVPREQIVVTAYGETRPLVPTADGVREPQNRRVEIVLR